MSRLSGRRVVGFVLLAIPLTAAVAGCSAADAAVDGFFGGISDAVATIISEAILSGVSR